MSSHGANEEDQKSDDSDSRYNCKQNRNTSPKSATTVGEKMKRRRLTQVGRNKVGDGAGGWRVPPMSRARMTRNTGRYAMTQRPRRENHQKLREGEIISVAHRDSNKAECTIGGSLSAPFSGEEAASCVSNKMNPNGTSEYNDTQYSHKSGNNDSFWQLYDREDASDHFKEDMSRLNWRFSEATLTEVPTRVNTSTFDFTKPVCLDPSTGAISKRHSYMKFTEHKSKPLPPLHKILSDLLEQHSKRGETQKSDQKDWPDFGEFGYRAAGGFTDPYDSDNQIEEYKERKQCRFDENFYSADCDLPRSDMLFYNSSELAASSGTYHPPPNTTTSVSEEYTSQIQVTPMQLYTPEELQSLDYIRGFSSVDVAGTVAQPIFRVCELPSDDFNNDKSDKNEIAPIEATLIEFEEKSPNK